MDRRATSGLPALPDDADGTGDDGRDEEDPEELLDEDGAGGSDRDGLQKSGHILYTRGCPGWKPTRRSSVSCLDAFSPR